VVPIELIFHAWFGHPVWLRRRLIGRSRGAETRDDVRLLASAYKRLRPRGTLLFGLNRFDAPAFGSDELNLRRCIGRAVFTRRAMADKNVRRHINRFARSDDLGVG